MTRSPGRPACSLGVVLLAALAAVFALPMTAFASAEPPRVSSADLVERSRHWDGRPVVFEGEVIGDAMRRGEVIWLHVNDDAYSTKTAEEGGVGDGYNSGHAVIVPVEALPEIAFFGDHGHRGDRVRVSGTFRAADPRSGGDMLIEAAAIDVVAKGAVLPERLATWKLGAIGILATIALTGWMTGRRDPASVTRNGR